MILICLLCKQTLLLPEHWLYKEEFGLLGRVGEAKFAYNAVSPMDSYQCYCNGRPFGGSAVLWRKSLQISVSFLQVPIV